MPGKKFTVYIDEYLIKEIKKIAIDKETSASQILNDLVKEYIEKEKLNNVSNYKK